MVTGSPCAARLAGGHEGMSARGDGDEPADGVAGHPAAAGATAAWASWAAVPIDRSAVTIPMASLPSSGRPGRPSRG
jgi:hypothetical protein